MSSPVASLLLVVLLLVFRGTVAKFVGRTAVDRPHLEVLSQLEAELSLSRQFLVFAGIDLCAGSARSANNRADCSTFAAAEERT